MKKRFYTLAVLLLAVTATVMAQTFNNETLKYKVQYKWGLISKVAGYVDIKLQNHGDRYKTELTAASAPWADSMYKVRDTLRCEIVKNGFKPVMYEKISHEGGTSGHDVVRYSRNGSKTIGNCTRKAWKKGRLTKDEQRTLEAEGLTLDMFSAFYYMRSLPYDSWASDHSTELTVFSGKRKEKLTIVYHGEEPVKYDGHTYRCHHITFRFTQDDGRKSSDDMDAWITTDGGRIPVLLVGNLPVGKIKCYYQP